MNKEEKRFWKGLEETRKQIAETDRKLAKRIEGVSDGFGRFLEGIIFPSAERVFKGMGYKVIEASALRKVKSDGRVVAEYDTMLFATKDEEEFLIVGEVGSNMASAKIKGFVKSLRILKEYLPKYKDCRVVGFVAGSYYGKGVESFAISEGLYVFRPSDEQMVLEMPKGFKPKIW